MLLPMASFPATLKPLHSHHPHPLLPFKPPPHLRKPHTLPSLRHLRCSLLSSSAPTTPPPPPPSGAVPRKRKRYRRPCPGETEGIVQEMRFVAMKLRNDAAKKSSGEEGGDGEEGETWRPSMEGFLKYLVDSRLVFDAVERIVDESSDVAYAYFRKTGLERSASLSKDLDWFSQQGNVIPEPGPPGITYATYLQELAERSAPSFLCHFYNIYFAHIAGGQGIGEKVCEKLLEGRELEFYKWEGDAQELLKDARQKLNKLGEHWSRDEKNKCLREASKSFKFSGQIVRLIIL